MTNPDPIHLSSHAATSRRTTASRTCATTAAQSCALATGGEDVVVSLVLVTVTVTGVGVGVSVCVEGSAVAGVSGLAALHPVVVNTAANRAPRKVRRMPVPPP